MPDLTFDSLDAVPEGLKEHAKAADGKFVVKVVPQVKLDEFRETNISLSRERDTLKAFRETLAPLAGEDPAAFVARVKELNALEQKVKDGQLKGDDTIAAEVTQRIGAMKSDFERQLAEQAQKANAAQSAASAAEQKYQRSIVERHVTEAVVSDTSGALPSALKDILARAMSVFEVGPDGKMVAKDGAAIIYGSDGATPMSPREWLQKLKGEAPYFFKNSGGGGASGGNGRDGGNFAGPMSQADFNKLPAAARLAYARKHGMIKAKS
jgi:uncharacterized small protein (DUF1192 family)